MADTFSIDGSWTCEPRSTGQQSSDPSLDAPLNERVALAAKEQGTYTLSSASVVPVSLGGIDVAVGAAVAGGGINRLALGGHLLENGIFHIEKGRS